MRSDLQHALDALFILDPNARLTVSRTEDRKQYIATFICGGLCVTSIPHDTPEYSIEEAIRKVMNRVVEISIDLHSAIQEEP